MVMTILVAAGLVVVTVSIHAAGFSVLLRGVMRSRALTTFGFRPVTRWAIGLTRWLVLVHVAEIVAWGVFYVWSGCLPDAESAICFSGVTYTAVGYGEPLLPKAWRMLAPLGSSTGILMCGLSTGLFFAFLIRWIGNWMQRETA
jgi:hypothetical protein